MFPTTNLSLSLWTVFHTSSRWSCRQKHTALRNATLCQLLGHKQRESRVYTRLLLQGRESEGVFFKSDALHQKWLECKSKDLNGGEVFQLHPSKNYHVDINQFSQLLNYIQNLIINVLFRLLLFSFHFFQMPHSWDRQ